MGLKIRSGGIMTPSAVSKKRCRQERRRKRCVWCLTAVIPHVTLSFPYAVIQYKREFSLSFHHNLGLTFGRVHNSSHGRCRSYQRDGQQWSPVRQWRLFGDSNHDESDASLPDLYKQARSIRIQQGAWAAMPYYQSILTQQYPPSSSLGKLEETNHLAVRDVSTASHMAASPLAIRRLERLFESPPNIDFLSRLQTFFVQQGFVPQNLAPRLLGSGQTILQQPCPTVSVWITPLAAGQSAKQFDGWYRSDHQETLPHILDLLTALFLVGMAVPLRLLRERLSQSVFSDLLISPSNSDGILIQSDVDPTLVFSLCQVVPMALQNANKGEQSAGDTVNDSKPFWIFTDWHPRVLSLTTIRPMTLSSSTMQGSEDTSEEDAVMYIGPDSVALLQHFVDQKIPQIVTADESWIIDVCTGSGVQAIASLLVHDKANAICVDVNPRALRFTAWNAALNGISCHIGSQESDRSSQNRMTLVLGDLLENKGRVWTFDNNIDLVSKSSWEPLPTLLFQVANRGEGASLSQKMFDLLTANPPFLPVPSSVEKSRHGLFSAGGDSGELVLAATVRLASYVLRPQGGTLAIVSEFFLEDHGSSHALLERIQDWWRRPSDATRTSPYVTPTMRGLLLTNEYPIDAETYAQRRSDSVKEVDIWKEHLERQNIAFASPGFFFARTGPPAKEGAANCELFHELVPKSSWGSIWTPSNEEALHFTRSRYIQYLIDT